MIQYPIILALLAGVALLLRDKAALAVALVLLGNWAACHAFSLSVGDSVAWLGLAAIDYVSAVSLMLLHAAGVLKGRWWLLVLAIYAFQLVCHVAYGIVGEGRAADYYYYWTLSYGAWGQAVILGGWTGGRIIRAIRDRADPRGRSESAEILPRSGDGR